MPHDNEEAAMAAERKLSDKFKICLYDDIGVLVKTI